MVDFIYVLISVLKDALKKVTNMVLQNKPICNINAKICLGLSWFLVCFFFITIRSNPQAIDLYILLYFKFIQNPEVNDFSKTFVKSSVNRIS